LQIEHFAAADVALAQTIVRLLDRLKDNSEDEELHSLLSRGLQRFGCNGQIDENCARWMHRQLDLYATDSLNPVRSRIRARLLQQRLCTFLPDLLVAPDSLSLAHVGIPPAPGKPGTVRNGNLHYLATARQAPGEAQSHRVAASIPGDTVMAEIESPGTDAWTPQREALVQQLAETNEQLRALQAENEKLREDFTRLQTKARRRKEPSASSRSGAKGSKRAAAIPKRDGFLRQLEIEIDRVRRHGAPLALALVDIVDLESVERERGKDAVDAVLRSYASEIFGNFRSYDIVGRYHDDEYALLFPNTMKEGALRALEKAQKRAAETHYALQGQAYPLPGFAGALTHYVPGEEPDTLLARAVDGIIEARGRTDDRIVVT